MYSICIIKANGFFGCPITKKTLKKLVSILLFMLSRNPLFNNTKFSKKNFCKKTFRNPF